MGASREPRCYLGLNVKYDDVKLAWMKVDISLLILTFSSCEV